MTFEPGPGADRCQPWGARELQGTRQRQHRPDVEPREEMKPKILPIVWYTTAFLAFGGTAIPGIKVLGLNPLIVVGIAWILSIVVALLAGAMTLKVNPDLGYSTHAKIDGLGYVHQPMGVVVYMTITAVICALTCIVKMLKG
jgi:hypothetical protein